MKLIVHDGVCWIRAASLARQVQQEHPNLKEGIREGRTYQSQIDHSYTYVYKTKTAWVVRPTGG